MAWTVERKTNLLLSLFIGCLVAANLIGGLLFFWIDRKILEEKQDKVAKKYLMYLGRWQLTSITLYPVIQLLGPGLAGVFIANLIGGLIFFWVDRWIFTGKTFDIFRPSSHLYPRLLPFRLGGATTYPPFDLTSQSESTRTPLLIPSSN